jgi:RNA polymerase sigma factor (sigma-70 family)
MSAISAGDDHARFRRMVLPYLDDAYALARWLTGSRAGAEDVVQDAFLDAFRGIGRFSNGNARAWVLTIVRHTAYDWMRRNRPAALVVVDDLEAVAGAQRSARISKRPRRRSLPKSTRHCSRRRSRRCRRSCGRRWCCANSRAWLTVRLPW